MQAHPAASWQHTTGLPAVVMMHRCLPVEAWRTSHSCELPRRPQQQTRQYPAHRSMHMDTPHDFDVRQAKSQ
eukprot:353166-Chlamydomonas_euryale.AAC.2